MTPGAVLSGATDSGRNSKENWSHLRGQTKSDSQILDESSKLQNLAWNLTPGEGLYFAQDEGWFRMGVGIPTSPGYWKEDFDRQLSNLRSSKTNMDSVLTMEQWTISSPLQG